MKKFIVSLLLVSFAFASCTKPAEETPVVQEESLELTNEPMAEEVTETTLVDGEEVIVEETIINE
ncbi:hypothetical protein PVA44_02780 [Entomospira nematocerorum]|uniref:Uncharacterized protein n=1 Tax=Entomospira nematocerorum TaxID=2719987 RepID=A0A968KSX1_9SPIO|nr:hypothetical protein [Entomospira nematocera]NIZ47040.1 hypothetical protein [Entomospira nematocera]WDI34415.1 hypothetical protein PVA44_02780 [Entomospira nematocera]